MEFSRRSFGGALIASAVAGRASAGALGTTQDDFSTASAVTPTASMTDALAGVSIAAHGAVGDAVVLADAQMSYGTRTLRSATARFGSSDVGKLIYVMQAGRDGRALRTTISAVTSANEIVLADAAGGNAAVLGGPNVNAVYGTDNGPAIVAAFAQGAADAAAAPAPVLRDYGSRRGAAVPPGAYLIGNAVPAISVAGSSLLGGGPMTSVLYWCEPGPLLQLGTYEPNPRDAFQGTATNFRISGVSVVNPLERPLTYEGRRQSIAVQDNGSGSVAIDDAQFAGLRYAFAGAYGSDFTRIGMNVGIAWCDVGAYFGPGGQQLLIAGVDFFACREGLVLEGALHVAMNGSSFEDPAIAAVTIEARSAGRTRFGVPVDIPGHAYAGSWTIGGCWFESDAGTNGRKAPRMIRLRGTGPGGVAPAGLVVRDSILVSGGQQVRGASNSFVEYSSPRGAQQAVVIDNLRVAGSFINSVYTSSRSAAGAAPIIRDTPLSANVAAVKGTNAGAVFTTTTSTVQKLTHRRAGRVSFNASASDHWVVQLSAEVSSSQIVAPPSGRNAVQTLSLEWRQDRHGGRRYAWPKNCRFASGRAPSNTRPGSRTTVVFDWDPVARLWYESSRTVGVG